MSWLNLFYFVNFVTQMVVSTVFLYHCYNLQLIIIIIMIIFVLTYSKLCNNIVINFTIISKCLYYWTFINYMYINPSVILNVAKTCTFW